MKKYKIKYYIDPIIAAVLMVFLSPVIIVIASLILCLDGMPVVFKQSRVGKGGRMFTMYKFRTMSVKKDAEKGSFDLGCKSRVTKLGHYLRSGKLDELLQFWNVLLGDMTIVGPRPEVGKWVAVYPEKWKIVLSIKPGITDPASIEYRNEERILASSKDPEALYRDEILPRKFELYNRYISNYSWSLDISVCFRTIIALFRKV